MGNLVVTEFVSIDLVDQLGLMLFPTILGRGKRLFPDGIDRLKLRLADTQTVGSDGVLVATYGRTTLDV
jgi:dihydrofolate reductase